MPIVQVSQVPSRAMYESVAAIIDLAGNRPDGLVLHAAGETERGDVEIVDVWASREQAAAFERERLFPAFQAAGVLDQVQGQPRPVAYEPFEFVS